MCIRASLLPVHLPDGFDPGRRGGVAQPQQIGRQIQRYRLAGDVSRCQRHLHLQCRRCGRIQHMECSFMDEIYRMLEAEYGFALDCETSTLSGLCRECRGMQAEEEQ